MRSEFGSAWCDVCSGYLGNLKHGTPFRTLKGRPKCFQILKLLQEGKAGIWHQWTICGIFGYV